MGTIAIGGKPIGEGHEPFIIAEAGINHNGDINLAKKMIEAAKQAGADAVKFQTFRTEEFIQNKEEMYTYHSQGIEITESQYEIFKRTEFSEDEWREIKRFCDEQQIIFFSTPVSVADVRFLITLGIDAIKVGSDDFVNIPLLREYAKFGLPLILSCGMATECEIRASLNAIGKEKECPICLMLCTSEYPTPAQDVNATKLLAMAEKFPDAVLGFSDHTQGSTAAIVAMVLGAKVFEKHFTLNHGLPGPDHWFSADIKELKEWVEAIHTAYEMLGNGELKPTRQEEDMRIVMRRSITAIKDIRKGETLSAENLALLRPGNGLRPSEWDYLMGKIAAGNIKKGRQLSWKDIREELFYVDRGAITCNSTVSVGNVVDMVYEKLIEGGRFIGVDWFSNHHDSFHQKDAETEFIDENTRIFHKGEFSGLGMITFFSEEQIYNMLEKIKILELSEKRIIRHMPKKGVCASWNLVAEKSVKNIEHRGKV